MSARGRVGYADDPRYRESERLYQESIALQKAGDPRGSTKAYLAAMEIQAQLPSLAADAPPNEMSAIAHKRAIMQLDLSATTSTSSRALLRRAFKAGSSRCVGQSC